MKKIITIALLAVASSVSAEGMGVIAGTTGFGIEVASPLSKNWNFRLHATGGNFDKVISIIHPHAGSFPVDIQYDADLELINIGALVDWYPGGSIFRVTAGNFYTKRKFNVTGLLELMVPIGNNSYTSIETGSLTGFIETENLLSPYFGIGLGKKADSDDGLDVSIDFGVIYTYTGPKVSLTADGLLASDPTFMSDLAEEERIISSSKYFKVYPVMSIGITYKF